MAGEGNAIWDYPISFKVTMYTDDDNTFKEKRLAIKIKASTPMISAQFPVVEPVVSACSQGLSQEPDKGMIRHKTVAKGEVDLAPLLSKDGSVQKAATHIKYGSIASNRADSFHHAVLRECPCHSSSSGSDDIAAAVAAAAAAVILMT